MATTRSVSVDLLLRQFEFTRYETYHEYMRGFLLEAMGTLDKSPDTILYELQMVNKAIYEYICKSAIQKQFEAEHSQRT